MMCRFLNADFELAIRCPLDKRDHKVRFQAYPQLRDHGLDVIACDAVVDIDRLSCGKNCRALLESGHYWQSIYPDAATYSRNL